MDTILDGTYLINLDSDVQRLQEFNRIMTIGEWKYERFAAVNGKKLLGSWDNIVGEEEYNNMRTLLALRNKYVSKFHFLSKSEIGCLLSHVILWEKVATTPGLNRIAIFEDDARTHIECSTMYQLLSDFYAHLTQYNIKEPDMLYLGKALDDCMNYEKVWGNVYKSKHPLCLHAYIMTKKGAQKLLKLAPYNLAIDMVPIRATEAGIIEIMAFHPSIYFQDVFGNASNLRKISGAINHTSECLVTMQHVASNTWQYSIIIGIGIIATIALFIMYYR